MPHGDRKTDQGFGGIMALWRGNDGGDPMNQAGLIAEEGEEKKTDTSIRGGDA
jgi:hypothetical protein